MNFEIESTLMKKYVVHYKGKGSVVETGDGVPRELKERHSTVDFGDKGLPLLS